MTKATGKSNRLRRIAVNSVKISGTVFAVWAAYMYFVHIRYNGSVETVSIPSDGVTLRGWFVKPEGPGPHPAVIILHGSGPLTGDAAPVRIQANAFLRSGVSVLTYDKRGVGGSGGKFVRTAYQDFIEDGISAVRYLKSRADVADGDIGLVGNSEGGWFTPEIAHRTGDVSFIINRAGPPLPWIETNLWETRHELKNTGVEGEALEEDNRLRDLVWRFVVDVDADPSLADGEKWDRIDAELAAFDLSHGTYINKLPTYDAELYRSFAAYIAYDPQPFIERLNIPMLYIFAENDEAVPTEDAVSYLQSLPHREGRDIEISVIPGVKHDMLSFAALLSGSAPGFINVIGPWATARARDASNERIVRTKL
jgi:pimeloyl-ACP methyl ester carboxylesterase